MNASTKEWLAFAIIDLRAAEVLFDEAIYSQVCFHCQQCVEKCLKATLVHLGKSPPRIHSITDLLRQIPDELAQQLPENLIQLDLLYAPTRYPDTLPGVFPDGLPDKSKAAETLDWAHAVSIIIHSFVDS
jgi:HEPN domain-containing protein